ncbi:two-component system OmpR family sensor kinase [Prauserella sediminis]|uniref:histidine kinase n=1 Tax=Prauserella sediminis TaxID=577680 RepID=A0A839XU54_9PSEU|nr:ATP-binding protein [Prauserella sediminis]MBB3665559.1 two-component system OmpR family sensor kinase [Prauserella sediminis]
MAATATTWRVWNDALAIVVVEFIGLTLVAGLSTIVIRRELRPLEQVAASADAIAAGAAGHRLAEVSTMPSTEIGRLSDALNRMLDQVETSLAARAASEQRMRQFVADASHELRTPLQSLRGYAELYQRGALTPGPEVDDAVDRMLSEVRRMGNLVESLLTLARFDETERAEREPADLSRLVAESCRDAAVVEPDRPQHCDIEPHLTVLGDEAKLRSLLANLLGNVRTHTPPDTRCAVGLRRCDGSVTLTVRDEGPGIPEHARAHVFDRFYRADRSRSRSSGGNGLGLAIVAAVAELHQASVELRSAAGYGTTVTVAFPAMTRSARSGRGVEQTAYERARTSRIGASPTP